MKRNAIARSHTRDAANFIHEVAEVFKSYRLRPVRHSLIGVRVDLDENVAWD